MPPETLMKPATLTPALARPAEILLVEDNPGDIRLMREALREGKIANRIHEARDGVEAMDFLRRRGPFADAPRPDLVLLDLNLPRMDGREVLAELKADPDLRRIPVVVLTTSQAEEDVLKVYNLHANCYMTKPVDLGQFLNLVKTIEQYWLVMVRLPQE